MAPEGYIKNRYGPKTDVWAFGIVLYELLHGFTPFHHCQNDDDLKNCQRMPLNPSQIRWDVSF
jgi:serine/threonine protein kinase